MRLSPSARFASLWSGLRAKGDPVIVKPRSRALWRALWSVRGSAVTVPVRASNEIDLRGDRLSAADQRTRSRHRVWRSHIGPGAGELTAARFLLVSGTAPFGHLQLARDD